MQSVPGTRIDEQLRRHQSDLAFSVRHDGREVLIYILVEHKRRPERWAVFQLLEYVIGLWRDLRKQRSDVTHLPLVVPVLVLQSSEGAQPYALADLLPEPGWSMDPDQGIAEVELDLVQPQFAPYVVELDTWGRHDEQDPVMTLLASLTVDALVSLPAANAAVVRRVFARWNDAFRRLLGTQAGDYALHALWSYTADVIDVPVKVLVEIVEETMDPLVKRKFKPPSEQWRDQGREQGLEQGLEQGRREGHCEVLRRLLVARFGELAESTVARLESARVEQLEVWSVRVLDAVSLDAVFAD